MKLIYALILCLSSLALGMELERLNNKEKIKTSEPIVIDDQTYHCYSGGKDER